MGWVSGDELRNASVDPIVAQGFDILSHMNADHRDSLVELVAKEIGEKLAPASVLMTNISSEGFVISVRGKKPQSVVCSFSTSVTNAEEARRAIIELLKGARST
jgi:putative heme iron utilization protein